MLIRMRGMSISFDSDSPSAVSKRPSADPRSTFDRPVVSVVMSIYNGERFLREAVESILSQSFTNFEFIIVDDGSTDHTWQVLTGYAARDARIVLARNEGNIGLTRSLNRGLALARGEYIARQDADDFSLPERLSSQIKFLEEHPEVGAVGSAVRLLDQRGRVVFDAYSPTDHETLCAYLLLDNCLCHTTLVVRSNLLKKLGGYDPELPYAQDYDLWWRLSRISLIRALPVVLACKGTGHTDAIGVRWGLERLSYALQISVRAMRDTLKGRSFDEEAYARFWRAYQGQMDQVRRGDSERLRPLWESLASQPTICRSLGPKLIDFAARLFYSHPHECTQMLGIATRVFGQTMLSPRTVRSVLKGLLVLPVLHFGQQTKVLGKKWFLSKR